MQIDHFSEGHYVNRAGDDVPGLVLLLCVLLPGHHHFVEALQGGERHLLGRGQGELLYMF